MFQSLDTEHSGFIDAQVLVFLAHRFNSADILTARVLWAQTGRAVLTQSGLPTADLRTIWVSTCPVVFIPLAVAWPGLKYEVRFQGLADATSDGKLDAREFAVAQHLIAHRKLRRVIARKLET
eukprot:806735-Rhodomonas_salina.2